MGKDANYCPPRTMSAVETEQFHATRKAEVAGPAGRELVEALFGRASLLPAWRTVLEAAVPALHEAADALHAAKHPESPGGGPPADAVAERAGASLVVALRGALGAAGGPVPVAPPVPEPEPPGPPAKPRRKR